MLFGIKLVDEVYSPWKDSYISYEDLKKLLTSTKQNYMFQQKSNKHTLNDLWTDKDESKFVAALDYELEKVYGFQISKYNELLDNLDSLEKQVDNEDSVKLIDFTDFQKILDDTLSEAQELDRFSRLNFTGFIKIVKKHDKLHPEYPSVKSLLQVRLKKLPFHSEEYSPLLYKISFLYSILRNTLGSVSESLANSSKLSNINDSEQTSFQSFKFWVHPDNLVEVKTRILRHLPVLVYVSGPIKNDTLINKVRSRVLDINTCTPSSSSSSNHSEDEPINKHYDSVINSLYFDNDCFQLYNGKLMKSSSAPTLRLRWNGKLSDEPDIFLEKRMSVENLEANNDFEGNKIKLKEKFINSIVFQKKTEFKVKALAKLKDSGAMNSELTKLSKDFDSIQQFIVDNELQPVLRAMYTRTAFQIPGDDRIRITIDSDIIYIREDSFDKDHPIRTINNWHRLDIDADVPNPLKLLRSGEYSKFPYSVMEIQVRNLVTPVNNITNMESKFPRKHEPWINELTNSHLVKEIPKFSKYVQGVASLFGEDERLDTLPFWLPDLEYDIRKDPKQAYDEEKRKLKKKQEEQEKMEKIRRLSILTNNLDVLIDRSIPQKRAEDHSKFLSPLSLGIEGEADLEDHESSDEGGEYLSKKSKRPRHNINLFTMLTNRNQDSNEFISGKGIQLPPNVKKPITYIKNAGPIKVEPKVWLANERTFNKWLSMTTLLSGFTFSIYNSIRKAQFPEIATILAYIYFGLTIFSGIWGYHTYKTRLNGIRERSGQHLDAPLGPLILAAMLAIALCINFFMAFRLSSQNRYNPVTTELPDHLKLT